MSKTTFEAEVFPGLESFAISELRKVGGKIDSTQLGSIRFRFGKSLTRLGDLRVVSQVFEVHSFNVPRPKALLGQQHFDRLAQLLQTRLEQLGNPRINSFRLEAAGKESPVFQRLIAEIAKRLKLDHVSDGGGLFLRVIPSSQKGEGWEVLIRMSRRPLATRSWRQFNYPGALSGPIAAAMAMLGQISPNNTVLNVMCGSGSLLAEIQLEDVVKIGCDLNREALSGARLNLRSAGRLAKLQEANAMMLPYKSSSFDVVFADLPWAQLIGETHDMDDLYTMALNEAFRVSKADAKLIVVTQLKSKLRTALNASPWRLGEQIDLKYNRVSPSIYVLTKTAILK